MLSYRHAFHAGNHADVLKHVVLLQLLQYFNQKDKPYWVIDTHAGAGVYALDQKYAAKNMEYNTGISRLWQSKDVPGSITAYIDLVRSLNADGLLKVYPGSPWIAAQVMRADDRLRAFDLHPADAELLQTCFANEKRRVKIERADGFAALKALLPPPSRRGLVLMDPPYEEKQDYQRVVAALKEALKRFETGCYALWYPMLQRQESMQLVDKLKQLPLKNWLHVSLAVSAPAMDGLGMHGSGMFIINQPWTLYAELASTMPWLTSILKQYQHASYQLEIMH